MGVPIASVKKMGFLRQMAEQAKRSVSTIRETLISAQTGHFVSTFQRSRLVVSQSGSGQSGSFEITTTGREWTQDNVFGLIEELIQLLDFTVTVALPDDATEAATNALLSAMIDNISSGNVPAIGSREQMGDFSNLRTW